MSKRKNKCCCEKRHNECCCYEPRSNASDGLLGSGCTPIIFLLIACGSGLLNCNKSYLIILLFILCGGCFSNLLGGGRGESNCCC
ncbi:MULTISPECIES: hypothetical protein [Clostridium]|jgi:hypothetical protein|uniref:Uncharacterized protein n=4 Tax=Clostridium TaxID=1485 RepID=A0A1B9BTX9_CLOBE|nr:MULTISPECIES: hypothetical protein [Clostridium]ABR33513.1 conserved hypothetical protein [Clostridium beijerinckii NCIMB 8052]AIU00973.1 hypothetical protein Cbs_1333 [Clostridium beijerinckii ATCC 35702]ALB47337.1 hypothetical protein X276_19830 [Clostridium beijerinckii NRRL B-598]AQS03984.1 hypothetical protein CLBIJ_13990 [Clostridium beijerinckii]AVK50385.1 hypothetical protein AXY43_21570 [Clostridium sp. MF28]